MANLSVTLRCNQACDYCFAAGISEPSAPEMMSWETFEQAIGFLKRSGVGEARFLGGEPTLHPRLAEMIQEAVRLGFQTLLFSNGLLSRAVLDQLQAIPSDRFSVLINSIPPTTDGAQDRVERQCRTLEALGPRSMLGLNIWQAGVGLDFLLEGSSVTA